MSISVLRTIRRAAAVTSLTVVAASVSVLTAPTAFALDAPVGLAQEATGGAGIPVLKWNHVAGASSYKVKVAGATYTTTNNRYVPTSAVPAGQGTFEVQAVQGSQLSDWSAGTYNTAQVPGPQQTTPADGTELQQPTAPPLLTWQPVPGALEYEVRFSQNPNFTDLVTTQKTKSPQVLLANTLVAQAYYWDVRARIGNDIHTRWASDALTAPRSFTVRPLAVAQRVTPATDDTVQTDVVFDWDPIPGAVTYDIQISPNINFTSELTEANGVAATRYSPPNSLKNDQYYWRVRATDISGNDQAWSVPTVWRVQKDWTEQPTLQFPEADSEVSTPFFYQWTPVKWASRYRLQTARNATFTQDLDSCDTTNTTYTPFVAGMGCRPGDNTTVYWRVIAFDDTPNGTHSPAVTTDVIGAQVNKFIYRMGRSTPVSPASGATVVTPTLTWKAVPGAAKYRVTVTSASPRATPSATATTASLSWTPTDLKLDCTEPATVANPTPPWTACSYRWDVVPVSQLGDFGGGFIASAQRTFTIAPRPASGGPLTQHPSVPGYRVPTLTWTDVPGATEYRVYAKRDDESNAGTLLNVTNVAATSPERSDFLDPGTYDWRVEAHGEGGLLQSSGFSKTFVVTPLPAATNRRVGHTGVDANDDSPAAGTVCSATRPSECQDLRSTPVLSWEPFPNTGYYELYISRNAEFTNMVTGYPVKVASTTFIPDVQLPDAQAGSGYFWHVKPCTADGHCAPLEYAQHVFNKSSEPVTRIGTGVACTSPGTPSPAKEADDVTFCWEDYLATISNSDQGSSALSTPGSLEARSYQIETSTDPTFSTVLDRAEVEQTTFTSPRTYPEGTIHWRVRAKDGSRNWLAWSSVGSFLKESPTPTLSAPNDVATVNGDVVLRWNALGYAGSYQVEVYKNGDWETNLGNRVVNATSRHAAWTGTAPLAVGDYVWRVKRLDANKREGGWSAKRRFTVNGLAPTTIGPAGGQEVLRAGSLFNWNPVVGAATYRLERRTVGNAAVSTMLSGTTARMWASTATLQNGVYEWRVVALDMAGTVLGTSDWARYEVKGALAVIEDTRIEGSGGIDTQLTGTEPTWTVSDGVTMTYQWYRGSSAIAGATDLTYTMQPADLGRDITLRVTGSHVDYTSVTSTSNPIRGTSGAAPIERVRPLIEGSGKVDTALTVRQLPEWIENGVVASYQWVAGDKVLRSDGATPKAFVVRTSDLTLPIALRVTGKLAGYSDSVLTSNAVTAIPADAVVATTPVTITGTPTVGSRLGVKAPVWDQTKVTTTYQWLRNGTPIAGATASTYTPALEDVTASLAVLATGTKAGYADGSSQSSPVTVPQVLASATLAGSSKAKKKKVVHTFTVKVSAAGLKSVSGQVVFYDKKKKLKSVTLRADGTAIFTTKKLKRGKHKIKAVFLGGHGVSPATTKVLKLVVRKR